MSLLSNEKKLRYRPEGWHNPYRDATGHERSIFEEGANAMFEMLLKEAQDYSDTVHHFMRHDDYLCDIIAKGLKL